jgi:hypothetical protein
MSQRKEYLDWPLVSSLQLVHFRPCFSLFHVFWRALLSYFVLFLTFAICLTGKFGLCLCWQLVEKGPREVTQSSQGVYACDHYCDLLMKGYEYQGQKLNNSPTCAPWSHSTYLGRCYSEIFLWSHEIVVSIGAILSREYGEFIPTCLWGKFVSPFASVKRFPSVSLDSRREFLFV